MEVMIISNQEIIKLNPKCFIIYSDNILESTNILDDIVLQNNYIKFLGVSYEPIDQPVYLFEAPDGQKLCVKVFGKYENWNLPDKVDHLIHFIDKPDFIIINGENGNPIFVGETTGTANVGNSQWQREGRKISAAVDNIPMIYQTYYSGSDRSKFNKKELDSGTEIGQVREPSSLQVVNHLLYSIRYRVPSFVVYYPNQDYDFKLRFKRSDLGKKLLMNYISICLLCEIDCKFKKIKKDVEKMMYDEMFDYILESTNSRGKKISRIDKDFFVKPLNTLVKNRGLIISELVDYINYDKEFSETLNIVNWNFSTFYKWSNRYKTTPLIKSIAASSIEMISYSKGVTKVGIVLDSKALLNLLSINYKYSYTSLLNKMNPEIPTLIIPTLMFQERDGKFIFKVDPGTGEIVAFSELFAIDIFKNKSMNVIVYVHVPGPEKFSESTKLFKAIKRYCDCLIINERIYEF